MAQWQTTIDELRKDQRVPLVIAAVLALLLLWMMWQTISGFIEGRRNLTVNQPVAASEHLQNLADLHLFGVYSTNLESLPTTQLQLVLEGTVVIVDAPTLSRALITAPGAPTKVYKVGDTLPGNATITRIAKQYVVLNDNGMLEKLALPINMLKNEE